MKVTILILNVKSYLKTPKIILLSIYLNVTAINLNLPIKHCFEKTQKTFNKKFN